MLVRQQECGEIFSIPRRTNDEQERTRFLGETVELLVVFHYPRGSSLGHRVKHMRAPRESTAACMCEDNRVNHTVQQTGNATYCNSFVELGMAAAGGGGRGDDRWRDIEPKRVEALASRLRASSSTPQLSHTAVVLLSKVEVTASAQNACVAKLLYYSLQYEFV